MDLGPIQANRAQLQDTRLLREQEHLDEELLELLQKRPSKRRQRIVIGMEITSNEAERHCLIGGALNLARAEHSCSIAIQQ
jgi:hypothetical protein